MPCSHCLYLVVQANAGREYPVHGLPSDPGPAPVLVLVVVVGVRGPKGLHLGLLPLTKQQNVLHGVIFITSAQSQSHELSHSQALELQQSQSIELQRSQLLELLRSKAIELQ